VVKKKLDIPDIPWEQLSPEFIKALGPLIQAVAWVGLTRIDPKIEQLNGIIALAEVIPNVDIGLPPGVVLGAMYDKQEEALATIIKIAQAIGTLPEVVTDQLETVLDTITKTQLAEACYAVGGDWDGEHCTLPEDAFDGIPYPPDIEDDPGQIDKLNKALTDCAKNAKKELGIWSITPFAKSAWIVSCMTQKGFSVTLDFVKNHPVMLIT